MHNPSVKALAFNLYLAGVPNVSIIKITKIPEPTLYAIMKREGWVKQKEETLKIIQDNNRNDWNTAEDIALNGIMNAFLKSLQNGSVKVTPDAFVRAATFKRLKEGLSTSNNSVKVEVSMQDAYQEYLKKKGLEKKGQGEFIDGVLPVIEVEDDGKD